MSGLAYGPHAARPVAGLTSGDLYLCTTHRLVYQTVNGGRDWASWGDLMAGGGDGGGVSVDNGDTTTPGIDTIVAAGAQINGTTATLVNARILGPYTVNYNDLNVGSDVHEIGNVDDGLIVLNAWIIPTVPWQHDGGAPLTSSFYLTVRTHGDDISVAGYENVQSETEAGELDPAGAGTVAKLVALTDATSFLGFQAYPDIGSLTAGVAAVYLLVADAPS